MRTPVLLILAFIVSSVTLSAAAKGAPNETKEKRQLLANHETLAVFDRLEYRLCRGRTALCPDKCGDSGEFATFAVKKYLKYEKPGQYGDPEQKTFLIQVSDYYKKPKGDPKILETVKGLKKGDFVLLSGHHDYVTRAGASFPERPIVKLEGIAKEKAEELMSAPAGKEEKEAHDTAKVTGTFIVPKDLASFEGRVVEIQLFKIHPMIADKPADLVEKIEIKDLAHTTGTETKKDFVIGAKAKLEKDMKYYLTLFILKDGERTHLGEIPGKFLCTVLTQGQPNNVTLTVKQVR
jgi:hypothetical protein